MVFGLDALRVLLLTLVMIFGSPRSLALEHAKTIYCIGGARVASPQYVSRVGIDFDYCYLLRLGLVLHFAPSNNERPGILVCTVWLRVVLGAHFVNVVHNIALFARPCMLEASHPKLVFTCVFDVVPHAFVSLLTQRQ